MIVWSVLDRRRLNYRKLHEWLRWGLRLILAGMMFSYRADKILPLQFGSLTQSRLAPRFGDLSRHDLLWGFMAASRGYTIFGGLAETLGGMLLLIPRLTTIGALVCMAVMSNVFALNLAYDVVLSFHLLLISIFLAAPELPRMANLLVWNRAVSPARVAPLSERRWMRRGASIAHYLLGACLFATFFWSAGRIYLKREATASFKSPFYGVWMIDQFDIRGDGKQSLFTERLAAALDLNTDRWEKLIFDRPNWVAIQCASGAIADIRFGWMPKRARQR